MAQLSVRLPDSLLESLREEARRSGFGNVSDYARRKLAASAPSSRIEQKIDRLAESLSLVSERTARIESRLEETTPSLPVFPSRPVTYSPTWIPPEPPEDEPPDLSEEILDQLGKGMPSVRAAAGEGEGSALYGREGCPARVPADTPCPVCGELHRA